jgi:hypothetical protein
MLRWKALALGSAVGLVTLGAGPFISFPQMFCGRSSTAVEYGILWRVCRRSVPE